jgi:hypothetical protein
MKERIAKLKLDNASLDEKLNNMKVMQNLVSDNQIQNQNAENPNK